MPPSTKSCRTTPMACEPQHSRDLFEEAIYCVAERQTNHAELRGVEFRTLSNTNALVALVPPPEHSRTPDAPLSFTPWTVVRIYVRGVPYLVGFGREQYRDDAVSFGPVPRGARPTLVLELIARLLSVFTRNHPYQLGPTQATSEQPPRIRLHLPLASAWSGTTIPIVLQHGLTTSKTVNDARVHAVSEYLHGL